MAGGGEPGTKEAKPPLFLPNAAKYLVIAVLAASAGMAGALLFAGSSVKNAAKPATSAEDRVTGRLIRHAGPMTVPDLSFKDAEGHAVSLSDLHGRMVLLNLWATWCAPCKTEMPSLDRLQAKLGGSKFAVVALSTDRGGPKQPAEFFARQGITHLKLYNDQTGEAATLMKAAGLPLTVVLNENGQEVARLVGPADWDSPEIIAQLESLKAGRTSGRASSPATAFEAEAKRL